MPTAKFRYPLLFSIKYLLTKSAITGNPITGLDEIIGAYCASEFDGSEEDSKFIGLMSNLEKYENIGKSTPSNLRRQARESIKVLAQISYLHVIGNDVITTLNNEDATEIFQDLHPFSGYRAKNNDEEILRLANLFKDGSTNTFFEFPHTIINSVVESGFTEGNKVKRTHVTIERNSGLRNAFFLANPTTTCDVCKLDTKKTYPWSDRIMDIHHLLPLSSGTRVESSGTIFSDLVPVCPSCHRAIHRFYDYWLNNNKKIDFKNSKEAHFVYSEMKSVFPGHAYAH